MTFARVGWGEFRRSDAKARRRPNRRKGLRCENQILHGMRHRHEKSRHEPCRYCRRELHRRENRLVERMP